MLEIILYRTLAIQWSLYPTSHTDMNVHCLYQGWPLEVLREAVGGRGRGTESNPKNTAAVIFGMLKSVEVVMIFEMQGNPFDSVPLLNISPRYLKMQD